MSKYFLILLGFSTARVGTNLFKASAKVLFVVIPSSISLVIKIGAIKTLSAILSASTKS